MNDSENNEMFEDVDQLFPTKNMKRRERRSKRFSVIEKTKKIFKYIYKYKDKSLLEDHAKRQQTADNRKKCDCFACQNPRKYNQVTLDEITAKDQMKDGLEEYYSENDEILKESKRRIHI
jgi:hypothetical protein